MCCDGSLLVKSCKNLSTGPFYADNFRLVFDLWTFNDPNRCF